MDAVRNKKPGGCGIEKMYLIGHPSPYIFLSVCHQQEPEICPPYHEARRSSFQLQRQLGSLPASQRWFAGRVAQRGLNARSPGRYPQQFCPNILIGWHVDGSGGAARGGRAFRPRIYAPRAAPPTRERLPAQTPCLVKKKVGRRGRTAPPAFH